MAEHSATSDIPNVDHFSKADFEVKNWINLTLKSLAAEKKTDSVHSVHLEERTNVMVTRLQLHGSQISHKVKTTTEDVMQSIPLVLYDLQLMRNQVDSIKAGIETVRRDMSDEDTGNRSAVQRLRQLGLVKSRMEDCRTALRETENWSNLEQETRSTIQAGDFAKAAGQLASAQKSINVFQNTPDYERRKELLNQLQDELSNAIRPQLDLALKEHDAVTCHNLYNVCSQIALPEVYLDAYFEYCQIPIVQLWESAHLKEDQAGSKDSLKDFLSNFFKEAFIHISEEYNWCRSVFPDPREAMQAFIQNLFLNLNPSLSDRVASAQSYYGSDGLAHVADVFQITESFGLSLERLFSKSVVAAAENEPSGHRRSGSISARRKSQQILAIPLALRTSAHSEQEGWAYVLYDPFLQWQSQFTEQQKKILESVATALVHKLESSQGGGIDISHISSFRTSDAFEAARQAIDVCVKLTHGFGAAGLLKDLNDYFSNLTNKLIALVNKLNQDDDNKIDSAENNNNTVSMSDDEDELGSMQDQGDWSKFQNGLRLLAICKAMSQELMSLELRIQNSLETVKDIVEDKDHDDSPESSSPKSTRPPSIGPFSATTPTREQKRASIGHDNNTSKLVRRESASFRQHLVSEHSKTRFPKASISLLRSSALNNFELARLMSNISAIAEEESEKESSNGHIRLLATAQQAITQFTLACQHFVFDVVLRPVTDNFDKIMGMADIWTANSEEEGYGKRAVDDVELPQFSQAPSEYMTRIGEQLLILPQQLEVYADDEVLSFMIDELPFLSKSKSTASDRDIESKAEAIDQVNVEFDNTGENLEDTTYDESTYQNEDTEAPALPPIADVSTSVNEDLMAEEVLQKWTLAICHGAMQSLVHHITSDIRSLSPQGSQQLRVDIEYMVNVLSALDVRPSPSIIQLHMLLGLSDSELSQRLKDGNQEDKVLQRVAKVRGIELLKF
ncbi:hypothetical protein INT43_003582 [Umbelopsis isabellina]|uniref:Conserved oligomeric Golgi complex subunit 7 n=1 Tax=Mortierella isabellina TaxID=91625 RepID=A0A8H7UI00_MORIS|nr:hypothetical protein INT43_003582 [Umbelopsis isabellina]